MPVLRSELETLKYTVADADETGAEFAATWHDTMRLNLHLRTAFSVLYELQAFPCATPDELYRRVTDYPWETIIPADGYLSVVSRVDTALVNNWTYVNQKVKDAIVDRIADQCGRRPDSGPDRHRVVINVYWFHNDCRVFFNTSGRKLADRGYRKMPHKAPLQETLAAGLILTTGYTGEQPLINPMCGSGTLAIEAALIAAGRAPGLLRDNFAFMHTVDFDAAAWQSLRRDARKQKSRQPVAPIIASDVDQKAIHAARQNATTAGTHHAIEFHTCDFADTPLPDPARGIVILNPEYGQRLGDQVALEATYKRIGDFLKQQCSRRTGYVFTGNLQLAKKIGLRAARRWPFRNARIDCRLLQYELYEGTRRSRTIPNPETPPASEP
jgi:putative N6-adenine-specific DNA methylase